MVRGLRLVFGNYLCESCFAVLVSHFKKKNGLTCNLFSTLHNINQNKDRKSVSSQCMCVCSYYISNMILCCCAKLLQSCLTLCYPMSLSPPGFLVRGIFQAKIWRGLPHASSRYLPDPGIEPRSHASCIGRRGSLPLEPPGNALDNVSPCI